MNIIHLLVIHKYQIMTTTKTTIDISRESWHHYIKNKFDSNLGLFAEFNMRCDHTDWEQGRECISKHWLLQYIKEVIANQFDNCPYIISTTPSKHRPNPDYCVIVVSLMQNYLPQRHIEAEAVASAPVIATATLL